MQITGIILAGGKSRRMGTDKALLEIEGQKLLERAIHLCKPICKTILVSSNNWKHNKFGYKIIPDEILDCGPIGGIYSCLKKSETDWNFVISVDAAYVESEFVRFLISNIDEYDALVPVHSHGKEPLIALYHSKSVASIEKMLDSGNYKMHNLFEAIHTRFVDSNEWKKKYPKLFHNLNRPEDFSHSK